MNDIIKTDRLSLRRWRPEDISDFICLSEDPQVSRWTGRTVSSEALFRHYCLLDTAFAIIYEGRVIGNISLFQNSLTRSIKSLSVYECAFYLFPSFWGLGLGSEALQSVLGFAGKALKTDAVVAGAMPENELSKKMIARNGGRYCFSKTFSSGQSEDFYVFSLI